MSELGPFLLPACRFILAVTYMYLLAGITREFKVWFWLLGFIFVPPEVQTMALACAMLWVLRQEKEQRVEKRPTPLRAEPKDAR